MVMGGSVLRPGVGFAALRVDKLRMRRMRWQFKKLVVTLTYGLLLSLSKDEAARGARSR
jgi:hypothetical protein